ncbi:hypothetical protein NT01EI_0258 [Edwardsiella ictaluri 93-146]|uniref:Uncharacterized protein n=1 Tax=Edwardsiella ictaluri (strain 93-146) TaxID=634503 RepID=C5BCD8_EDWI9|nr:hypothetical protein NT01EI_0258 [Edwardsiella ictaluri 93-146]
MFYSASLYDTILINLCGKKICHIALYYIDISHLIKKAFTLLIRRQ